MYPIKNDVDFETVLILMGFINYSSATPEARERYDTMAEDEKNFFKKTFDKGISI